MDTRGVRWPDLVRLKAFHRFFSILRPQVKAARRPALIPSSNSAENIPVLSLSSCLRCLMSDANRNQMLNANTTSSTSTLSGSCDAALPPPQNPPTTFDVSSFVSHGVSSSAQSALLFCEAVFVFSPPFSVLVPSFRHSLTLQASNCTFCVSPLPDVTSSGTDLVVVKTLCSDYRFTSAANQLFYCNCGAALMWRVLLW